MMVNQKAQFIDVAQPGRIWPYSRRNSGHSADAAGIDSVCARSTADRSDIGKIHGSSKQFINLSTGLVMTHYVNSLAGHFGNLLARREAELRAALETDKKKELAAEEARSGDVQDFKDLADRESQSGMAELDTARTLEELSRVIAARRRLQEGHYGRCVECGKPIDLRRLEALPSAACCVACQSAGEESPPAHHQSTRI